MLIINKLKQKFFNDWFPNWSPDIALRYLPIAHDIRKNPDIRTIVDVGSGSLGIAPYLKRSVTGVDVAFRGPSSRFLKQVKGHADRLPFKNKSFDVGVCVDTLEHIPKKRRKKVISELLRVTKKKVYVVAPCGSASESEDRRLFTYLKIVNKWEDPYLREHMTYGLPKEKEIISYVSANYDRDTKGLTNMYLRRLIMRFQYSNTRLGRFISSVIFILLLPLFLKLNFAPTYRKLFIITQSNAVAD